MNFRLLEEREDVITIFIESIQDHYKNEILITREKVHGSIPFYLNKHLNFLASTSCDGENFLVIKNEYKNSRKWWFRPVQWIYVYLFTHHLIYTKFNHLTLYFSGTQKKQVKNLLFMGGNTRFRIIDAQNQSTCLFPKKGYPIHFISNEIKWRKIISSTLVPEIIDIRDNSITEKLYPGIPINRTNPLVAEKYRKYVYNKIWDDCYSQQLQLSRTYTNELADRINNSLIKVGLLDTDISFKMNKIIDRPVFVCLSHGDMQDANIIKSMNGLKLIDWETVRFRSFMYDWVSLFGNIRHENIQQLEIKQLIKKRLHAVDFVDNNRDRINFYYTIFLLEELEYRLEYAQLSSILIKSDRKKIDNLLVLIKDSLDE